MTHGNQDTELHGTQLLISQLTETSTQVDENDLVGLARMHGWVQELTVVCSADEILKSGPVGQQANTLLDKLESLILGEAEDAVVAFKEMIEAVAELPKAMENALSNDSLSTPDDQVTQDATGGDDQEADDHIEAKLAKVFDDPSCAQDEAETQESADAQEEPIVEEAVVEETEAATSQAPKDDATNDDAMDAAEPSYEQVPLTLKEDEIDFVKGFVEEAMEHIEAIEAAVLEVETAPEDADKINDLFRPFHTIKGMAGFLNLRDISCVTHEVETLLDQGRKGQRKITAGLIDVVFDVVDVLKVQITSVGQWAANPQGESVPQPPVSEMIDRLRGIVAGRITPDARETDAGSASQKVGENLVEQGAVSQEVVDFALDQQQASGQAKKLGKTLVDMKAATPRQVSQAIRPQVQARASSDSGQAGGQKSLGDQSIRIDTGKLDILVDMVGELVIAQTLVNANSHIASDPHLSKDVGQVTKIVREVQQVAMAMRMVPIGGTFQKMARLVRDVSRKAGKQVNLIISGEDTELDKTVTQQIGDPLVHMVRNAVDHGIEAPEIRRAAGKPEIGQVHLGASHQGGNIVIEIRDDGKGLDPQVLINKAIEKGVIQPGEELTDQQAYHLVFAAGLSTAEKVTDISGRGVGMDVVKRNIEQLRGKVEITSKKGHGSTFSIRLPLTLAIIDGMIIRVGSERFIIPTIAIEQSLRPLPEQITTVQQRGEVLNVRGQLVPLIQLGQLFGSTDRVDPADAMVVVAHSEGCLIGLVVEELIGQQQVVIKTLGERFEKLRGISGAAILGDGKVGLILEMPGLAEAHQKRATSSIQSEPKILDQEASAEPTVKDDADVLDDQPPVSDMESEPETVEA